MAGLHVFLAPAFIGLENAIDLPPLSIIYQGLSKVLAGYLLIKVWAFRFNDEI